MTYQHKPDTGSLFRNEKRETDSQPHAKGSALIDGVEYWVAAWTNAKDSGEKYQNLQFTRKDSQHAPNPQAPGHDDPNDQIPF